MQTAHDIIAKNVQFRNYQNFPPKPVVAMPPELYGTMRTRVLETLEPTPVVDREIPPKQEVAAVKPPMQSKLNRRLIAGVGATIAVILCFSELPISVRVAAAMAFIAMAVICAT